MKQIYLIFTLLTLGLFSPTMVHAAPASICQVPGMTIESAQTKTSAFVQAMKIAKARGDVETMQKSYVQFYDAFLSLCEPENYKQLCGFECHSELVEYNLFMANELSYYYSVSTKTQLDKPESLMKIVNAGLAIVDRAREVLDLHKADSDLRDYLARGAKFNSLKAQLFLTAGDIWYQTVSEAKLERLKFIVNSAVTDPATQGQKGEADEARANYEQANWIIQSAVLEVPTTVQFSEAQADFRSLRFDVERRLNSLNKGYLFLDIDPQEFSEIPMMNIKKQLDELTSRIKTAEQNIESVMTRWKESKLGNDVDQINDEARKKEVSVEQSSYRIAQFEGMTEEMNLEVEAKLNKVKDQQASVEYEKTKFEFQFNLERKLKELSDRQEMVMGRKEIDVLNMDKDNLDRKISDLKWMMDFEIGQTNLKIQVSQYESQIKEYQSQIERKQATIDQTMNKLKSNEIQTSSYNSQILTSKNDEKALEVERDRIQKAARDSLEAQLCGTYNRLVALGNEKDVAPFAFTKNCTVIKPDITRGDYHEKMCNKTNGLRVELQKQNINTIKDTLCVVGITSASKLPPEMKDLDCGSKTLIASAKEIFDREMAVADKQLTDSKDQVDEYRKLITDLQNASKDFRFKRTGAQAVVAAADMLLSSMGAVPKTVVCACGLASGVQTEIDIAGASYYAVTAAKSVYNMAMENWAADFQENNQLITMENTLAKLKDAYDEQNFAMGLKRAAGLRAITEINGRSLDLTNALDKATIERDSVLVDCDQDGTSYSEAKAQSVADYERVNAEILSLDGRISNIELSIKNQKETQQQHLNSIEMLKIDNNNLNIENTSLASEKKTLEDLVKDTETRKSMIETLQGRITDLNSQVVATANAFDAVKKLVNDKTLAMSDKENEQLIRGMSLEQEGTKKLEDFSNQLNNLVQIDSKLKADLTAFKTNVQKNIGDERDKIINTVNLKAKDLDSGAKTGLFMATQEEMAAFSKGIPNFIKEKRQLLEDANRLLVILKNQIDTIMSLKGKHPLSLAGTEQVTYVKNSDDLQRLRTIFEADFWGRDQQLSFLNTTLTINKDCGLARSLATDLRGSFEITPAAQEQSSFDELDKRPNALGCYALWSNSFNPDSNGIVQNLVLVDMNVLVEFEQTQCQARPYVLKHMGSGFVFKEASASDRTLLPSMVVANSRRQTASYYTKYEGSYLEHANDWWAHKKLIVNDFLVSDHPETLSSGGVMPTMMGLPLIVFYEIQLSNPPDGCSYENATFKIFVTYATSPRQN